MIFRERQVGENLREIAKIARENEISTLLAKVLSSRGIVHSADVQAFLHPDFSQLNDPFLLDGMACAVERIRLALEKQESICIYGDYDADGVCASAILYSYLKTKGAKCCCHIPARHTEGYGMHPEAIRGLHSSGVQLIITVDNGIAAVEEIALCTQLGLDVIVTDHHQCPEELPDCVAVLNPHLPNSGYPFSELCGAGVALKLVEALGGSETMKEYLPLCAIATVADIVPLVAENRAIVALGLPHLHKYPGVLALLNVSGSGSETDVSGDTVAFRLAPRINAAGRMGDAKRALQLLTTNDSGEAFKLAAELNEENALRQSIEQKIFNEAQHMLRNVDTAKLGAIVLCSPDWNPGVIGIVASKLVELHYKPVLLFHQEGDLLVGSCRSTSSVHLYETLETFSKYFIRFGGHAQAAGITMERAQFETFAEEYNSYIQNTIPPEAFDRISLYDAEVELSDLMLNAVEELRLLAPYGLANPQPVLRTRNVCLRDIRRMGNRQNHLRAIASKGTKSCQLVAFGQGEKHEEWENAAHVDMLYTAALNEWMGNTRLQLQHVAINIEPAFMDNKRTDKLRRKFYDAFFDSFLYNDSQQNSVQASTKEECRLALSGSRFGTLVLCLTLEGAREFWKDAQTQGICSSISICYGKTPEGSSSQNTLLLAPQCGGLDFSKYERVFVYDCPYVELLRFSGEVYVCEDAKSVLLEPLRLNREEMGKLFIAARAALGGGALEKGSLLAKFDMKCYDSVSLAILVFIELELMRWNKIERSIVLIESASRRDLLQSMLYRLANEK